ncbi:hypothetical protein QWY86_05005 [Pedobacter aquatilis]|uniref:hypothetical protein n=1 Tax=Pedobacter aquatilis TaxID=351343 RepID=UPI0025B38CF3|nr:hypothetical protein [Pedobacter aquatilis]MDN3586014.1 hypothetical protein [Pedobacter aquatilis]
MAHTFHIPVLGLAYSIDTPLKVAKFGISSVVSIVDDELCERMRQYHAELNDEIFVGILKSENDFRAKRITAYLNLIKKIVDKQIDAIRNQKFEPEEDIIKYFELLPQTAPLKIVYELMLAEKSPARRKTLQKQLRNEIKPGRIDVNIMAKVDKINFIKGINSGLENSDALAALRGFANSNLNSAVVISAGLNPRLYSYLETFEDFYPTGSGVCHKQIILKVSDFRSANVQAKLLAKKGLWVSEFRIESGLNCGGHAFATEGLLLGPILREFKNSREALHNDLLPIYTGALNLKGIHDNFIPEQRITAQGGIGTAGEQNYLMENYGLDATGWGSPFLLVDEATSVDSDTLNQLVIATEDDFYLSNSSPLGVPFNNFRKSSVETERMERIAKNRPGSPCTKKYLCSNTEFTTEPICTASRKYQNLKIKSLESSNLSAIELSRQIDSVTEKICLCEGLCSSTYIKYNLLKPKESKAISICPGPNLAYFSKKYTLKEMIDNIYGRINLLDGIHRPNLFTKELKLYIDYFNKEVENFSNGIFNVVQTNKKIDYLKKFYNQLQQGVDYYRSSIEKADANLKVWSQEQISLFEKAVMQIGDLTPQLLNLCSKSE